MNRNELLDAAKETVADRGEQYGSVWDNHERIAINEANKLGIPVIGIVDSNSNPDGVDFVIPGNDDAIRAIRLYVMAAADAILAGRAKSNNLTSKDEFVEVEEAAAATADAEQPVEAEQPAEAEQVAEPETAVEAEPEQAAEVEESVEAEVAEQEPVAEEAAEDSKKEAE